MLIGTERIIKQAERTLKLPLTGSVLVAALVHSLCALVHKSAILQKSVSTVGVIEGNVRNFFVSAALVWITVPVRDLLHLRIEKHCVGVKAKEAHARLVRALFEPSCPEEVLARMNGVKYEMDVVRERVCYLSAYVSHIARAGITLILLSAYVSAGPLFYIGIFVVLDLLVKKRTRRLYKHLRRARAQYRNETDVLLLAVPREREKALQNYTGKNRELLGLTLRCLAQESAIRVLGEFALNASLGVCLAHIMAADPAEARFFLSLQGKIGNIAKSLTKVL